MNFFLLLLVLVSQLAFAHEKEMRTIADKMAYGVYSGKKLHPWPLPLLSIGNNMQTYQDYGGSPYWHDGLDMRARMGESVHAAAGGKVVNIQNYISGNPLYWEVAILDDEGFVWKYHHVNKSTITNEIQQSLKTGTKISEGTLIGNIVEWPITSYGEVYHHLHMLVVAKDGKYLNPFLMMEPLHDNQSPIINRVGLAQNHHPIDGNEVKGSHSLFVEASDLVLHQKFQIPPHKISYRMDGGTEKVVWEFINLPSSTNDTQFISDFFLDGTCGNYSCRRYYFNLNFSPDSPRGQMNLKSGSHQVDVTVEDIVGNKASKSFEWKVL